MCSRASVRSVAAMRLSLLRLAAAAGATAAVLASSPSARAADAVYGGSAGSGRSDRGQGRSPRPPTLRSIVVSWRAACADGRAFPTRTRLTPSRPSRASRRARRTAGLPQRQGPLQGHAAFRAADLGAVVAAIVVEIEGKLTRTRASGTLSAIGQGHGQCESGTEVTSCQTGTLRWVATRAPGIVYGGTTSQGEPLVVRLNAQRKRVTDVITAWRRAVHAVRRATSACRITSCNFAVKTHGPLRQPVLRRPRARRRGQAPLRLRARRALTHAPVGEGHAPGQGLRTDASGAATDSCDTGGVTW